MHEVHVTRRTHLQARLVKPVGTLINAIAGQNDTFSLPLPLLRVVLTLCLEVFFNKVSNAEGRGEQQKKALTTTFSSFYKK